MFQRLPDHHGGCCSWEPRYAGTAIEGIPHLVDFRAEESLGRRHPERRLRFRGGDVADGNLYFRYQTAWSADSATPRDT